MVVEEDDDLLEHIAEILEMIAEAAGVEAEVRVEDGENGLFAEFIGDDLAVLIGHHGQTIDAIQHLAHRIAFHGLDERVPLTVDAAGYRERRRTSLQAMADQAAESAVRERRPVQLEPMASHERKQVHEYLKSRFDVETYSEGQEPTRRLVVAPIST